MSNNKYKKTMQRKHGQLNKFKFGNNYKKKKNLKKKKENKKEKRN